MTVYQTFNVRKRTKTYLDIIAVKQFWNMFTQ